MDTSLTINQNSSNLELARSAWLDAKSKRSGSAKTARAYQDTLDAFRSMLHAAGLELDSPTAVVSLAAQGWAGGREVAPATYNQRLAILSSFYSYAKKQELFEGENPISRIERRPVQSYAEARALEYDVVKSHLAAIDRTTLEGKRDYALLSVAIQTGRRLTEIASLRWGDLRLSSDSGKITLHWKRTKGGKTMSDTLTLPTSRTLMDWLSTYYGAQLATLSNDTPVWVSLSHRNQGAALTIQSLADICQHRLGVSRFHSLRHSFARAMEDAGAKVSDIQARLGHSSLAVTGKYLSALRRDENEHADAIGRLFGLD